MKAKKKKGGKGKRPKQAAKWNAGRLKGRGSKLGKARKLRKKRKKRKKRHPSEPAVPRRRRAPQEPGPGSGPRFRNVRAAALERHRPCSRCHRRSRANPAHSEVRWEHFHRTTWKTARRLLCKEHLRRFVAKHGVV